MQRQMLKSKIHRATVTGSDPDYVGSITLDPELMRASDLLAGEQVHVWDIENGARFVTYAIEGGRRVRTAGRVRDPWKPRAAGGVAMSSRPVEEAPGRTQRRPMTLPRL